MQMTKNLLLFLSSKYEIRVFTGISQIQETMSIDLGIREVQIENQPRYFSGKEPLKMPIETKSSSLVLPT